MIIQLLVLSWKYTRAIWHEIPIVYDIVKPFSAADYHHNRCSFLQVTDSWTFPVRFAAIGVPENTTGSTVATVSQLNN